MKDFTKRKIVKTGIWNLIFIFVFTFSTPPGSFVQAQESDPVIEDIQESKFAKGRFIVKFREDLSGSPTEHPDQRVKHLNKKHKVKSFKKLQKLSREQVTALKNSRNQKNKAMKKKIKSIEGAADDSIQDLSEVFLLEVDEKADIEYIVRDYQEDSEVEYAQPDFAVETSLTMNDPYFGSLWGMPMIQVEQAWDTTQGEGVIVGIVDTGIDYDHEDLAANMWVNPGEIANNGVDDDNNGFIDDIYGWDFAEDDNDPWDGHYHGTHVAGTVAAVGNNGIGVVGVAPRAKLMAIKGLSDSGSGYSSDLAAGIEYAALNGADVINNSWGCSSSCPSNPVVEDAVRTAHALGSVIVFAAGNSNVDTGTRSPNNMQETISVAASTSSDAKAYFSNWGPMIDVTAPGYGVYSSMPGNDYGSLNGTSMASPHVAGLAALIIAHHPAFTNEEVRHIIRASADEFGDPGFDIYGGHGRINAHLALQINVPLHLQIDEPATDAVFTEASGFADIIGTVNGGGFVEYRLEYKPTDNSADWVLASGPFNVPVTEDYLGDLPLDNLSEGEYFFKILSTSNEGIDYEEVVQFSRFFPNPLIQRIGLDGYIGSDPIIHGNYVVWADYSSGSIGDLMLYDIQNQTITEITQGKSIYYYDMKDGEVLYRTGNYQYVYDIDAGTHDLLLNRSLVSHPRIMQDYIVWQQAVYNGSAYEYRMYSFNRNTAAINEIPVSTLGYKSRIVAADNKVAYYQYSVGLSLFDIITNTEVLIDSYAYGDIGFDGQKVVYDKRISFDEMLQVYDVQTQSNTNLITTQDYFIEDPTVSGNKVSYLKRPTSSLDYHIYQIDLTTNEEEKITVIPVYDRRKTSTFNNRIVWYQSDTVETTSAGDIMLYNPDLISYPPELSPIGHKEMDEGEELSFTVSATDVNYQLLSFSRPLGNELPAGASFAVTSSAYGSLQGQFTWSPDYNQAGTYDILFEVFDGESYDSELITITINDAKVAPVITSPPNGSFIDDSTVEFQWTVGESVSKYWLYLGSTQGAFDIYNQQFNNGTTSAIVSDIPLNGETLHVTLRFQQNGKISQRYYQYDRDEFINYVPVLTDTSDRTVTYGENVQFTLTAMDANNNEVLTFLHPTSEELPAGATFNVAGSEAPIFGTFNWTPTSEQVGNHTISFEVSDGELTATQGVMISVIEPTVPVIWTDIVGVNANGNTITKTSGAAWDNGGAASVQYIPADGGVDILANETDTHRMVGLSYSNPNESWSTIEYALFLRSDGQVQIYEDGAHQGFFGTYQVGDRFIVERNGTTVYYKKNGSIFYTNATSSSGNLIVDTSLYSPGGTVADAKVFGAYQPPNNVPVAENQSVNVTLDTAKPITLVATDADNDALTYSIVSQPSNGSLSGTAPNVMYTPNNGYSGSDSFTFKANDGEDDSNTATVSITVSDDDPIIWTDLVGVSAINNTITKTSGSSWSNGGAASVQHIPANGGVDIRADETNTHRMIGLSYSNPDPTWETINHALFLRTDGLIQIYENQTLRGTFGGYQAGDRFIVERVGTTIQYKKNDVVIYTSPVSSSGELMVDTSIYSPGGTVADAMLVGGGPAPNNLPVANDQGVNVTQDTAKAIVLVATDADNDSLTYSIVSQPSNGSLSGTAPNVTYTPNSGYTGSDSFTFKANDGEDDSNTATVSITVSANSESDPIVWTDMVGVSANGNTIMKTSGAGWSNGGAASVQHIPADGGVDFRVDETNTHRMVGLSSSNTDATWETINYALFLRTDGLVQIYENQILRGTFGSYQVGDRFIVERSGATIQYKKNDTVFYTSPVSSNGDLVIDTSLYSPGATVADAVLVGGGPLPNNPPVANDQSVNVTQDTAKAITLVATDGDNDTLTYSIVTQPSNGLLSGTAPNVTYTPNSGYTGNDSFTFKANDGEDDSNTATVSITVNAPSGPDPVVWTDVVGVSVSSNTITKTSGSGWSNGGAASVQTIPADGGVDFRVDETNTHRMVGLSSSNTDATWETINYALFLRTDGLVQIYENQILRGTFGSYQVGDRFIVERSGATIQYKKNDTVFYTSPVSSNGDLVIDTSLYSPGATVADAVLVGGGPLPNNPPVANDQSVNVTQDTAKAITLVATDGDNDTLTYSIVTQPSNGLLSGTAPNVTYTPNSGYTGNDSFTFKANDGEDDSNTATVSITVNAPSGPDPVVWTDVVGVSVSSNTITKTSGSGWSNGGAASVQTIPADGGVDFRVDETNTHRMVGLSSSNTDATWETINYALFLRTDGLVQIYENQILRGTFGSYQVGDRFIVERSGATIQYKKNDTVFYTSPVSSNGDLVIDTSLYSPGATVADAVLVGGGPLPNNPPVANDQSVNVTQDTAKAITLVATDGDNDTLTYSIVTQPSNGLLSGTAPNVTYTPNSGYTGNDSFTFKANDGEDDSNIATVSITVAEAGASNPIEWTDMVGVSANSNTIMKTAGSSWSNGGAASVQHIPADGGVDFRANETNTHRMIGLSSSNADATWETINYALFLRTDGLVQIYENQVLRGTFGSYSVGDRFTVERDGTTIQYKKNDTVFYTSPVSSNGELVVDVSIYSPGGTIADAYIVGQ